MRRSKMKSHSVLCMHIGLVLLFALYHASAISFDWGGTGDLNFSYDGDASVYGPHELKLTMGVADAFFHASSGRIRYAHPISLCSNTQSSFNTSFTFQMSSGLANAPAYRGDGIAFFVSSASPNALPSPPLPSTKGLFGGLFGNSSRRQNKGPIVFAVEFDSSQESWDSDDNHVGVDIGSVVSSHTASLNASGIVLNSGRVIAARIEYLGKEGKLAVYASYVSASGERPVRLLTYRSLSLCSILKGGPAIVGFSSASRGSVETHDLLSWTWQSS
ncbi:hypothetical protein L7F22_065315 [Adiantum nelumboides]|nr:hypothetical protein [Adiantum nelumboides]